MIRVPFFELKKLYEMQSQEIDEAVNRVLKSGWFILGDECRRFEEAMTLTLRRVQDSNAGAFVGCNSGTDALSLSLLSAGVSSGDEVIVVSHTAIPTITAIVSTGATPVFVDVDGATWLMDISKVSSALTEKTKAVVAVHLYGNMVDIPRLSEELKKQGREDVAIIEDTAQAQGAVFKGSPAGTLGRYGAFSFYPTKNLGALGDGGGIFATNKKDVQDLKVLRNYGQVDRYNAERSFGMNSRLDEIQAAILSVRLPFLERWNKIRSEMMSRYREELGKFPIKFQKVTEGCQPAWHLAVIKTESAKVKRDLANYLEGKGIQTLVHYPIPTHQQKAFGAYVQDVLPITEELAPSILSLPMNVVMSSESQDLVIDAIKSFFSSSSFG